MKLIVAITIATLLLGGAVFAQVSNPSGNQPASNPAEPSASPAATASATTREASGVEDQLKKLEDEWARASMNKDRAAFERIEADNYIFVLPDGNVRNKTQDIDTLAKSNYTAFSLRDMQVRVFGDVAQVLGVAHLAGTENGQDVSGEYRFTDVFVNKNGKWQAVSTHASRLQPANTQTAPPPQR
jgi:ketosteroid isomerase-like protein